MFPSPQSALPLPPNPDIDRYRKVAKELLKASRQIPESLTAWASDWVDDLVRLSGLTVTPGLPVDIGEWKQNLADFGRRTLLGDGLDTGGGNLTGAQFVIARSHGFRNWPIFTTHLREVKRNSPAFRFEAAADAIVAGDCTRLRQLLHKHAGLIRLRSTRSHGATLLHYLSANGVEGYRQKTPANIVEVAELLLQAGADIHATADVYGHACTTLELTATSIHPEQAGVQQELLTTLLNHSATVDDTIVAACLANGRLAAAQFLAEKRPAVTLAVAAGIGGLDRVVACLNAQSGGQDLHQALSFASQYGHDRIVELLIHRGADIAASGANGQTALHWAVIGGHLDTVKLVLNHRPPLEAKNSYGGTAMSQALWSAAHANDPASYVGILQALADAGAELPRELAPIHLLPLHALIAQWFAGLSARAQPGEAGK